jgi:hypothetical protein
MKTTTFENAQAGDIVYSIVYGWGIVVGIRRPPHSFSDFPIVVKFSDDNTHSYTIQGVETHIQNRTLFWQEIKFEAPAQPVRIKLINGVEIPDISFKPSSCIDCYTPLLSYSELYRHVYYLPNETNKHLSTNGLCYPFTEEGKQAAILHTKAMLGIS